jgi:hypothetical protein
VELGNADAMTQLGDMYMNGDGVKWNKKKAMQLFRAAAENDNAIAQAKLAIYLCEEGDLAGSVSFVTRSAEQGFTVAEHFLGRRIEDGEGVEVDLDEARRWYARAAARGYEPSINALARLDREAREAESERVAADLLRDA